MAKARPLDPGGNHLLNALARQDFDNIEQHLETVCLEPGQVIFRQGAPIDHLYFPTSAILSWIATTRHGERVDVGVVGWEGMVGIPELIGYEASPYAVEVALPGEAIRLKAKRFKAEFERFHSLHTVLFRYTHTALIQLAQASACDRLHRAEERLARWLLMVHDRAPTDELRLTQEILAGMIGVRRETVTMVLGALQKTGLIRTGRGRITLLDRAGMEAAACECYPVIRREFDQFLGIQQGPGEHGLHVRCATAARAGTALAASRA